MNLNPRVSSNFSAALISPKLPSLIKSGKLKPWFWYCLATDTTKTKIGTCQFFQCYTVTLTNALSEFHFFLDSNQVFTADFLQILIKRSALSVSDTFGNLLVVSFFKNRFGVQSYDK